MARKPLNWKPLAEDDELMKPGSSGDSPIKYAQGQIDRAAALREDPGWVEEALNRSETRLVVVSRSRHLLRMTGLEQPGAVRLSREEMADHTLDPDRAVFLGLEERVALFAIELPDHDEVEIGLEHRGRFVDLRRFGALLNGRDANLLAYARAMLNWHRNHRFCGRCGAATLSTAGGHRRQCTNPDCGQVSFPRTDPAVIALVEHSREDGGPPRCLLGRSPHFPPGMYSCLAGFVEPGESLEQTVRREVFEEAGIELGSVRYLASQPWPFPGSLMLGFQATAISSAIRLNDEELEDVRWFSLDEVARFGAFGEASSHSLPRSDSIARYLIDNWREAMAER